MGSAPIAWAMVQGDKTTGVTTMMTARGIDNGDMLLKAETPIEDVYKRQVLLFPFIVVLLVLLYRGRGFASAEATRGLCGRPPDSFARTPVSYTHLTALQRTEDSPGRFHL